MPHVSSIDKINYGGANATMRTTSGEGYPIKRYGAPLLTFRSSNDEVPLFLRGVAHIPILGNLFFSLRVAADNGHTYSGNKCGVTVKPKARETLFSVSRETEGFVCVSPWCIR